MIKILSTATLFLVSLMLSFGETSDSRIFEPDTISKKGIYEFGSALSIDGKEIYFSVKLNKEWKAEIRYTKLENGEWIEPVRLDLDTNYTYNDPFLSEDENRLYFVSDMPLNGKGSPKDFDIWYIEKNGKGWGDPINLGPEINTDKNEFYVSISQNGTIYFVSNRHTISEDDKWDCDIYYSELIDGVYQEPVRLNNRINSEYFEIDPFIAPDESYLIFASMKPGGYGEGDLYISFKDEFGNWTKAKNMGQKINSEHHEFCPQVSKDGKYLYYTSKGDIYCIGFNEIVNKKEPKTEFKRFVL